jgi:hypothetical protein
VRKLSQAEVDAFHRDGFLAPVDVFPSEEARAWRADLEAFERTPAAGAGLGRRPSQAPCPAAVGARPGRGSAAARRDGAARRTRHTGLHQYLLHQGTKDRRHYRLAPRRDLFRSLALRARHGWVALSEASIEAGCMEFAPGSHRLGQLAHGQTATPGTINAGARSISEPLDTLARRLRSGEDRAGVAASHAGRAQFAPEPKRRPSHRLRHQLYTRPCAPRRQQTNVGHTGAWRRSLRPLRPRGRSTQARRRRPGRGAQARLRPLPRGPCRAAGAVRRHRLNPERE